MTDDDFLPSNFSEKSKVYLRISKAISEIKQEFPVDLIVYIRAMHNLFIRKDSSFARELMTNGKMLYEKVH